MTLTGVESFDAVYEIRSWACPACDRKRDLALPGVERHAGARNCGLINPAEFDAPAVLSVAA
ncbi:MAG TPA: hypothetical protein VGC77_08945 [Rhodopseudomonas sp.]|uniref:hypothetical protein n=1 Tax=Rhodopseudomonas sp. TaxID=1078 RepID=UPI002ED7BAC9